MNTLKLLVSFETDTAKGMVSWAFSDPKNDLTKEKIETAAAAVIAQKDAFETGKKPIKLVRAVLVNTNKTEFVGD